MPFSESLAERVRQHLSRRRGLSEKRMFGGLAFLLGGNMLVGVWEYSLVVRLGPDAATKALTEPRVQPFDVAGRAMRGWVIVEPDGLDEDRHLRDWIARAFEFVSTLPAK
jgi:TfoX/Sxy family transcriptional regulator of competence genes